MENFKEIVNAINSAQMNNFVLYEDFKDSFKLKTKQRGLYWIWSSFSDEELELANYDKAKIRHVNIPEMITNRKNLNHICNLRHPNNSQFKVIYNGIGGYRTNTKSFGLRERIFQELNCNDHRTGTLNFLNLGLDTSKIAVSYINFDDEIVKKDIPFFQNENVYNLYAKELEMMWRLEFGHPILCKH